MSPSVPGPRRTPGCGRRAFAATWWGQAWVAAVEDSTLDAGRLSRGRTYARQGMVGPVTIAPGQVKAPVQGSRPRPYRSAVHLPVLTDTQWDTLLDSVAGRAGHLAALLDDEMPAELIDDARNASIPLLPQPAELDPECSCPDWGDPCKHAAALCYAIAATIDDDPFVLFALRGRTRAEVLAGLRARRTANRAAQAPPAPAGIHAAYAYAAWADRAAHAPGLPDLPDVPKPSAHTAALLVAPPADSGVSLPDLERLMADVTVRARQLLSGDATSLHLTQHQDAVRIAASSPGAQWFQRLVQNTGTAPTAFALLTRAWRHGGLTGIAVAEQPHTPNPAAMTAARTTLNAALAEMTDTPVRIRAWRNRLTLTGQGIQLRLGPDALWYPCLHDDGEWWLAAPPATDPVAALTAVWQLAPPHPDR